MTLPVRSQRRFTVDEYLKMERDSADKHEYRNGEIVSMAGGSVNHSLIIMNAGGELRARLKGKPCMAFDSNLRVRISRGTLYSYPDVAVICAKPEIDADDDRGETVTNPTLIVEVLSPTTETYDRKEKFDRYRGLESFREYVLIAQDEARVETYYRKPDGSWQFDVVTGREGVARLRSLEIDLPLAEIYAGVEFPAPLPPPPKPPSPELSQTPDSRPSN